MWQAVAVTTLICDECRFDSTQYTIDDCYYSIVDAAARWAHTVQDVPDAKLRERPSPTTWSAIEYFDHSAYVFERMHIRLQASQTRDFTEADKLGPIIDAEPGDTVSTRSFAEIKELMEINAAKLGMVIRGVKDWDALVPFRGAEIPTSLVLRYAAHDCNHHLHDAGRVLATVGAGVKIHTGTITQISANNGGVDKKSVAKANIGYRGVEGDRQNNRKHHGRVWQALCLYGQEVIERLQAEGNPILPGNVGENVTISGLDWATLRPGTIIKLGTDVVIELSAGATPCAHNAPYFVNGNFNRMNHDQHPGWSRLYASVLVDGVIRVGDSVEVEPVL